MDEAYREFLRTKLNISINNYNETIQYMLKLYIINNRKLLNAKSQHKFLIKCRIEDIIPNFIANKTRKCLKDILFKAGPFKSEIEIRNRKNPEHRN